ncbi:hypothetical protein [Salinicola acroporae]|uniref:Uncharacterized protein n=1 Tax=Salinicola acroporae TaxID=1541440 RepID=A0ABT6I9C6_9GAMM|nr:hypothetical protein [Salinicola acroporae]MDH4573989.1 hypothetical protein [Salinicola acroporae]
MSDARAGISTASPRQPARAWPSDAGGIGSIAALANGGFDNECLNDNGFNSSDFDNNGNNKGVTQ